MNKHFAIALILLQSSGSAGAAKILKKKPPEPSALDHYIEEALSHAPPQPAVSTGSLWMPGAPLGQVASDVRAARVDDVVSILVTESASALSSGTVKTQRNSSANASVTALGHKYGANSALPNLAGMNGNVALDGQGSTMRQTSFTTTMTARVTHVLPNNYLVVEGKKLVQVNSEQQVIVVRGVVRPADLAWDNTVSSDRLAQMEVSVNGKGVVNDAIRRPMFLYRLLTGLLPF